MRGDGQTDTRKPEKFVLCGIISHRPLRGRCPKRHGHYLEEDGMEAYIKNLPRLSLRRGKNLGDIIVNAKERRKEGRSGPCGKGCKLCKYMQRTDVVKDKDGKEMRVGRRAYDAIISVSSHFFNYT